MTTHLLLAACAEAVRARSLFPKTDHLTLALAEEAGEVVKAALDLRQGKGTPEGLRKELVQCMAMCIRLAEEGDAALGIAAVQPADPLPEVTAGMEAIMRGDSSHTDALVHRLRSARATIADLVAHGDHHDRESLASLDAFLATIP